MKIAGAAAVASAMPKAQYAAASMVVFIRNRDFAYQRDVVGLARRFPSPTGRMRETPPAVADEAMVTIPPLSVVLRAFVAEPMRVAVYQFEVSRSEPITWVIVEPSRVRARASTTSGSVTPLALLAGIVWYATA